MPDTMPWEDFAAANDDGPWNDFKKEPNPEEENKPRVASPNEPISISQLKAPPKTYVPHNILDTVAKALGTAEDIAGKDLLSRAKAAAFDVAGDPQDALRERGLSLNDSHALSLSERAAAREKDFTAHGDPYEEGAKRLPLPARALSAASTGLIQSAPQMAVMAAGEAAGVPTPLTGAAAFGSTPQGYDVKQGFVGAVLPEVGKLTGPIAETVAKRLKVSSPAALSIVNRMGGAAGAAGLLAADQASEIAKVPPEKRKDAIVDAVGNVASMAWMGAMGDHPTARRIAEIPKSADILPQAKQAALAAITEEKPNAISEQKTAAVHGNVRALEKPAEVLPVKEGERGVQPQTEAVAQKTQVPLSKAGEVSAQADPLKGNWTGDALQYGAALDPSKPEQLQELRDLEAKHQEALQAAIKAQDVAGMQREGSKKQWFTEAIQAATGVEDRDVARQQLGKDYKPPFPNKPEATTGKELTPAVEGASGKIYTAATHPEARQLAKAAGERTAVRGFVGKDGKLLSLTEVARLKMAEKAKAAPAVKEYALDPQHQEMLDLERKAIDTPVEVVAGPIPEGDPLARQIASIDRKAGKIRINPQELSAWLNNNVPKGQEQAAIRSLLGEERLHLATDDKSALAYHDSTTLAERAIAQRIYGGRGGEKLSPTMLGHEMLRMRMQQLARMGVRETIEASRRERWTVKSLLALSDAIRTAREVIGTKASKEGGAITDRIQENLDAAIAAARGERPAAKRKPSEERTPEFFLPPIKTGETRPGVTEAGALPEVKIPPEQALKTDTVLWSKPNAWRRVTTELLHKPFSLGKLLTEGSRGSESDPVSATRRLVAMEKGGKVDVVSIYPDAEDGARAVDPAYAGKRARPNVPIKALLDEGYRPIVSMLRTDAVQNFHRHFDSLDHFEQTVGKPGDDQWANVQGYEAQTAATQAPSFGKGTEMTDAEAGALHDHFIEHNDPAKAADAFAASPDIQKIRSGLGKAINQIMAKNPGMTRERAAGTAVTQLYEQAKSAEHRSSFIEQALGRFGQESPESAGHAADETVNDLGEPQPAEESDQPGAIRKFAQNQIKLTDDEIQDYVKSLKTTDELARSRDAAANMPNKVAAGEENNIRLASAEKPKGLARGLVSQWKRGKPEVLAAAKALVQGQFDRGAIKQFKTLVQQGMAEANNLIQSRNWRAQNIGKTWLRSQQDMMKELDYAEAHWNDPELQETARRMKKALDEQWSRERAAGIEVQKDPNYLPGRYNASVWNEHSILFNAIKGAEKILGGKYRAPKSYPTYYHAGADGPYIPATADGASLVGHRVRQGMNTIERDAWVNGLKGVIGPSGQPVAVDAKVLANGQVKTPGRDYEAMLINGRNIAVHQDFVSTIRNLTQPSAVQDWALTRGALRVQELLKHTAVIGDVYHGFKTGYFAASVMGRKAGWKAGWSALDIKPQNMAEAVSKGIISQREADWANARVQFGNQTITRRQLADKFIRVGANLGRIQDALYKDLIAGVTPGMGRIEGGLNRAVNETSGRWNRFLFDNWTRGIMTESNITEFEREMKANPNRNPEAVMRDIARDVNNRFGNIGRQGWLKSATQRDLARLAFFAPQWTEGLMKSEAAFYGRASGASKAMGRRQGVSNLGTTGRSVGRGLVFLFGLTQAINLLTKGHPTWKNDEEGHKGDAWIPGRNGEPGFWFSPLSVFNETTHDLWRYAQGDHTVMNAVDTIAGNKESALTHALMIAMAGATAGRGQHFTSTASQLQEAGKQLAPMPLTFGRFAQKAGHAIAPSVVPPNPPGSEVRQGFSALGIKLDPALDAAQEISRRAKEFAKEGGFPVESGWVQEQTDEPSYSKLRSALRSGDEAEAKRQWEALRNDRTERQIFHAFKLAKSRPFTGSKKGENAFIRSLDDKELALYYQALDQKQKEYEQFQDFALRQPEQ